MTEAALQTDRMTGGEGNMRRVLFVCTGNTCRSPMCAALFNDRYAGLTRHAVSAGLMVSTPIAERP